MKLSLKERIQFVLFENRERLISFVVVRWGWCAFALVQCLYSTLLVKDYYSGLSALLRFERDVSTLIGVDKIPNFYNILLKRYLAKYISESENRVLYSYRESNQASEWRNLFASFGEDHLLRMKRPRNTPNDPRRQGDLLVLKPYIGPNEKGVLFIQYDEGVQRFASLFDLERLAQNYRFVIEPSTSGYQNAMYFLCLGLKTEVVIEAQFYPDYQYIAGLGRNFHPIRLGAGDWADPERFQDGSDTEKKYDIVMIANWLRWKRHKLLFSSLEKIKDEVGKVAVIGYPIDGRTVDHVIAESKPYNLSDKLEFFDRIPHHEVSEILRQSKVGVLLSKEEGANRGIYECFFTGVPVILTDQNRGVNRDHITTDTGMLASDEGLPGAILEMLKSCVDISPRKWAEANTGYTNSTAKLNSFLKELALQSGEEWTKDIFTKHNSLHARFADISEEKEADNEVVNLKQFVFNG